MPEIESRLGRWLRLQPLDHIVVIEPDPNLREILMAEIRQAVPVRVAGAKITRSLLQDAGRNPRVIRSEVLCALPLLA